MLKNSWKESWCCLSRGRGAIRRGFKKQLFEALYKALGASHPLAMESPTALATDDLRISTRQMICRAVESSWCLHIKAKVLQGLVLKQVTSSFSSPLAAPLGTYPNSSLQKASLHLVQEHIQLLPFQLTPGHEDSKSNTSQEITNSISKMNKHDRNNHRTSSFSDMFRPLLQAFCRKR